MENQDQPKPDTTDIPQRIFTKFIEELNKTEVSATIVEQLEQTIITHGNLSEPALRVALTAQQPAS